MMKTKLQFTHLLCWVFRKKFGIYIDIKTLTHISLHIHLLFRLGVVPFPISGPTTTELNGRSKSRPIHKNPTICSCMQGNVSLTGGRPKTKTRPCPTLLWSMLRKILVALGQKNSNYIDSTSHFKIHVNGVLVGSALFQSLFSILLLVDCFHITYTFVPSVSSDNTEFSDSMMITEISIKPFG